MSLADTRNAEPPLPFGVTVVASMNSAAAPDDDTAEWGGEERRAATASADAESWSAAAVTACARRDVETASDPSTMVGSASSYSGRRPVR